MCHCLGAGAVNPYLALETVTRLQRDKRLSRALDEDVAQKNYVTALKKGLLKTVYKNNVLKGENSLEQRLKEELGVEVAPDESLGDAAQRGATDALEDQARKALEEILNGN